MEGFINLERVSEYAAFFDVTGELKTSKPIPATVTLTSFLTMNYHYA